MRILLVEDEPMLADATARLLSFDGWSVDVENEGNAGLARALSTEYDAVVLDMLVPGLPGVGILRGIRASGSKVPVLMLSALNSTSDRVAALDAGADGYMSKPFDSDELSARLRALTRRVRPDEPTLREFGDMSLDRDARTLTCTASGRSIALSEREAGVMLALADASPCPVSKEEILSTVWGDGTPVSGNSVETYVSFLRKKMRHIGTAMSIETTRGEGYALVPGTAGGEVANLAA